jgi:hypothetical protein
MSLMDDIKEGSVDLQGSTIDLNELDDAYSEDLDKESVQNSDNQQSDAPVAAAPTA